MSDRVVESPDFFKSLPAVSSLTGQKLISMDASGSLGTVDGAVLDNKIDYVNLAKKETGGSTIGLVDFMMKYVKHCNVGTYLHDETHQVSTSWYVEITSGLKVNMQQYVCQVMRKTSFIDSTWASVGLLFIPVQKTGHIYIVYCSTPNTTDLVLTVRRIPVEEVTAS